MRVGIICEGPSDFVLLEALALDLLPADECVQLHPDFDKLQSTGDPSHAPGWHGVRAFLQSSGPALALPVFDVLVIQVDASIRKLKELKLHQPDEADQLESLEPLCDHVKSWAPGGLPESAVIALPREDIEAWLVAAHTKIKDVESLENPAAELAAQGIVETTKKGRPSKDPKVYRKLAVPLVKLARDAKKVRSVPELERFANKLRARARKVRGSKR